MINLTKTQQTAMQAAVDEYSRAMREATVVYAKAENDYYALPDVIGLAYAQTLLPAGRYESDFLCRYGRELHEKNTQAARNRLESRRQMAAEKLHLAIIEIIRNGGDND